ncbi:hypothetical protein AGOR_G00134530 [Albula goreensis]|uniref:Uncharacterized protein n=1 Tax=Albula goreensis TaxID=1534307 RepID=A0A8T3D4F8_9TELE|nr:hypothetical protein AGOR_G00134530 [Albula goreensis]
MELGVLETAVILGLLKIVWSLLSVPALKESFNSVGFCCSCLLIFTDLSATVFLTLLWLAKFWQPQLLIPSDVIALRVLLFLDHTYGAVLLLTTPLMAVDIVCRMRWPLDSDREWSEKSVGGGWGRRTETMRPFYVGEARSLSSSCVQEEGRGASSEREAKKGARGRERGLSQRDSLLHIPGFLSCLLIWVLCSRGVEQDWGPGKGPVKACLQSANPLSSCLPDLLTVIVWTVGDPCRALGPFALSLILALNMAVLRGGLSNRETDTQTDRQEKDVDNLQQLHPQLIFHVPVLLKTPGSTGCNYAGSSWTWLNLQTVHSTTGNYLLTNLNSDNAREARNKDKQVERAEPVPTSWWNGECTNMLHAHAVGLSVQPSLSLRGLGHMTDTPEHTLRWPSHRVLCRGSVLMGLACVTVLCLLPPALAVNGVLIVSVERFTEWSLKHFLSVLHRGVRSDGETKDNVR